VALARKVLMLDVRNRDEFNYEYIQGDVFADNSRLEGLALPTLKERLAQLIPVVQEQVRMLH
jgi:hypothetical protein